MITIRKRVNPAVQMSDRIARASEDMAELAYRSNPRMSSLPARIAKRKRATADKIKKLRPYLIATE